MKVQFTYYLHDDADSEERTGVILAQMPPAVAQATDEETFGQLVGRPFNEVELTCELDTVTGAVQILSARPV